MLRHPQASSLRSSYCTAVPIDIPFKCQMTSTMSTSTVMINLLSRRFYDQVLRHPALKTSSLAAVMYCWLVSLSSSLASPLLSLRRPLHTRRPVSVLPYGITAIAASLLSCLVKIMHCVENLYCSGYSALFLAFTK